MECHALRAAALVAAGAVGCVGADPSGSPAPVAPIASGEGAGEAALDGGAAGDGDGDGTEVAPPSGCPAGCLPPAPAGWVGPSATYEGSAEDAPTCAAPYEALAVRAHQGMTAPAAVCACGAPKVAGASCKATFVRHATSACNDATPLLLASLTSSTCTQTDANSGWQQGYTKVSTTLTRGTCTFPDATKELETPAFAKVDVACGLSQATACEGRSDCVATPPPAAPFTRLCIHKDGDHACPSADYPQRFVAHARVDDQRSCSPCTGTTSGGACGSTWGTNGSLAECAASPPSTAYGVGTCNVTPSVGAVLNLHGLAPTGVTCSTSGGTPTGQATSADPITFCCGS